MLPKFIPCIILLIDYDYQYLVASFTPVKLSLALLMFHLSKFSMGPGGQDKNKNKYQNN